MGAGGGPHGEQASAGGEPFIQAPWAPDSWLGFHLCEIQTLCHSLSVIFKYFLYYILSVVSSDRCPFKDICVKSLEGLFLPEDIGVTIFNLISCK